METTLRPYGLPGVVDYPPPATYGVTSGPPEVDHSQFTWITRVHGGGGGGGDQLENMAGNDDVHLIGWVACV